MSKEEKVLFERLLRLEREQAAQIITKAHSLKGLSDVVQLEKDIELLLAYGSDRDE